MKNTKRFEKKHILLLSVIAIILIILINSLSTMTGQHDEPPVTEPPVTEPPVTEPPVTEPPDDQFPQITLTDVIETKLCGVIEDGDSTGDGGDHDGIMEVGEDLWFCFRINITNPHSWIMKDVTIHDNIISQLELHTNYGWILKSDQQVLLFEDVVTINVEESGNLTLTWNLGDLEPGETIRMGYPISTSQDLEGQQEFSLPGRYTLNSGAMVTFKKEGLEEEISIDTEPFIITISEPN